jgi:hypothetical protein
MAPLSALAGILGLSVVSGINLYLAVLTVGLAERFHWISGLPSELHILAHPAVLISAALLFLIEFFADKIPFVTVLWDGIHTFVRPVGGALLALGAAGNLHPTVQVIAMLAGGTIALGTHGSKMGFRLLAHTSPEPTTHSLISVAEDVGVVGLLALAYSHPYVAIPVLVVLILSTALMLPLLFRVLNFLLVGFAGRVMSWVRRAGRHDVSQWAELAILELDARGSQRVVRAFARQVKGAPRLKDGFLAHVKGRWHFIYRGLLKTRSIAMDEGGIEPLRVDKGLLWDSLVFLRDGKAQVLFLPKDWARTFHGEGDEVQRNLKEVY